VPKLLQFDGAFRPLLFLSVLWGGNCTRPKQKPGRFVSTDVRPKLPQPAPTIGPFTPIRIKNSLKASADQRDHAGDGVHDRLGIFIVSAEISREVSSPALLIGAWLVTGF